MFGIFLMNSCSPLQATDKDKHLSIEFLDVGQGDACFLKTSEGKSVLVDAGSFGCGSDTLLKNMGVLEIDDLILTHPHEDHFGNIRTILDNFSVKRISFNRSDYQATTYPDFIGLFRYITDTLRIDTLILSSGRILPGYNNIEFLCLWPPNSASSEQLQDSVNALSIVLKVIHGKSSTLFTGDINFGVESALLKSNSITQVTALKVAHHGSKTSSSYEFLRALSPLISIISVGRYNNYGHPEEETLNRISTSGSKLFRTDINGSVGFKISQNGDVSL